VKAEERRSLLQQWFNPPRELKWKKDESLKQAKVEEEV